MHHNKSDQEKRIELTITTDLVQATLTKTSVSPVAEEGEDMRPLTSPKFSSKLNNLKPVVKSRSSNLATYVNESEVLSNLVKLGVDLSVVGSKIKASNHLLKSEFARDIEPYLQFLHSLGVADNQVAKLITKNPEFFLQDLGDLRRRMAYLKSKLFSDPSLVGMVTKCPTILNLPASTVDSKLGFLQRSFDLSGDEVRSIIARLPKLIIWSKASIKEVKFVMKDICGFTASEEKKIFCAIPKVFMMSRHALETRFSFMHNTLGFSHSAISLDPRALRTRTHVLRSRHQFLKSLNRDQYNPSTPNFVSLSSLANGRDSEFVQLVAKSTIKKYDAFLKTL